MTLQPGLASIGRAVIDANSYMTLATADRGGLPWPSPAWYAHSGYREFFRASSRLTRHSRNLAERPQAGIVIFDSHVPAGAAQAVYVKATAAEVTPMSYPGALGCSQQPPEASQAICAATRLVSCRG